MSGSRNLQPIAVGVTDFNIRVRSHELLLNAVGFGMADTE